MDLIEIQEAITNDLEDIDNFYELIKLSLKYIEYTYEIDFKVRRPCNFKIFSAICKNTDYHHDNDIKIYDVEETIKNSIEIDKFIEAQYQSYRSEYTKTDIITFYRSIEDNMLKLLTITKKKLDNNLIIYANNFEVSDAVEKIEEAIYIINNYLDIDDKIKKTIIRNLEKTIEALRNKKFTQFYGRVKETLTILAAFGSIASGVAGVQQLTSVQETISNASESLNESITIIEQQIISINIEKEQYFIQPKTLNNLLTGQPDVIKMNAEVEEN